MKLIVLTIFCLVITETITGSNISGEHHEPAAVNNSQKNPIAVEPEPTHVPEKNFTTTTTTTTTANPNTTTTTTPPPSTTTPTTSTSVSPTTSSTTPAAQNITTTPVPHPTVPPTDSPAHKADRKFDSFSFIAGIDPLSRVEVSNGIPQNFTIIDKAKSTSVSPPTSTSSTTPAAQNITTTPVPHPTVPPTDSPAHKADRKFDSFSFIAGIVMAAGLMAIGLVAFKFYEARRDRNYHTI
ncbi:sialomucin core protein 24 [Nilaparvata lugens]|uniref:sialomucin core protein 24 n=1 Tax=Nilaparvata lugens TaxID=108931 RepID=UPI00193EA564|nr:sialomucin core protein 24 [Nilaparvata lugens]